MYHTYHIVYTNTCKRPASASTGSSPSHTFFESNYTKNNSKRNPETECMTFDVLDYALLTIEKAVKIMKHQQRNKEEDTREMHPRRPRGERKGAKKVRAKEPLGSNSHRTISKNSNGCRLLIGHKKTFVLLLCS